MAKVSLYGINAQPNITENRLMSLYNLSTEAQALPEAWHSRILGALGRQISKFYVWMSAQ